MQPRTKGIAAAATGTTVGLAGLLIMAMPADAGLEPELPELSATELVEAALSAEAPSFEGTVAVNNELGLPALPGLGLADAESARVYHDSDKGARISLQRGSTEFTAVHGPDGAWTYDSSANTATRYPHADQVRDLTRQRGEFSDPASAAAEIIDVLSESSTITIDGTARVADRDAYELVLTPKPSERTLLREVTVAIDAATKLPLRVEVMPNGSPEPVVSAGFTEFAVGAQPDELFEFTPPKDADVSTADPDKAREALPKHADPAQALDDVGEALGEPLAVTGSGWDTVLTGTVPEDAFAGAAEHLNELSGRNSAPENATMNLLSRFGERFTDGEVSGFEFTTRAGTGVVTDDGRFAVGAVPRQVLIEALEQQ
ncbi:LolA family protein [Haloechinothrix halophila]|uniref:LolA family protein n=1 Tax=Haloechinothrix halophila TaxID=1069073 RepID=UPI00040F1895|nr:sigma-E factor regulatory protein RseB domain-containing protein [Haloechinothrix halophila]